MEYSEQLLVINGRPRSMHCIIARRRRQNGNNSFKISANKSRRAKLEGRRRGRKCEKEVKERGIIRRMPEIRKSTLFGSKIIATESESVVEGGGEKEVKESA